MFFGLPVFRFSFLSNLQGRFHILSSFWGFVLSPLCLVILLISAILRAHFSYFSQGFFFDAFSTVLFFFLVQFFLAGLRCLLTMHALNSCVGDE